MTPPTESSPPTADDDAEFSLSLQEVEQALLSLKERYTQVQQDTERQAELQQRYDEVHRDLRRTRSQQLKAELRLLKQQLETLELNLESRLFSWSRIKEPFWQAVRFGGLGIVVGWILKSCAG